MRTGSPCVCVIDSSGDGNPQGSPDMSGRHRCLRGLNPPPPLRSQYCVTESADAEFGCCHHKGACWARRGAKTGLSAKKIIANPNIANLCSSIFGASPVTSVYMFFITCFETNSPLIFPPHFFRTDDLFFYFPSNFYIVSPPKMNALFPTGLLIDMKPSFVVSTRAPPCLNKIKPYIGKFNPNKKISKE